MYFNYFSLNCVELFQKANFTNGLLYEFPDNIFDLCKHIILWHLIFRFAFVNFVLFSFMHELYTNE